MEEEKEEVEVEVEELLPELAMELAEEDMYREVISRDFGFRLGKTTLSDSEFGSNGGLVGFFVGGLVLGFGAVVETAATITA